VAVDAKTFAIFLVYIFFTEFLYIGCDLDGDYAILKGVLHYPYILSLWAESFQGGQLGFKQGKYLAAGRRINNLTTPLPSQANLILG
jgi:hypothetical protein